MPKPRQRYTYNENKAELRQRATSKRGDVLSTIVKKCKLDLEGMKLTVFDFEQFEDLLEYAQNCQTLEGDDPHEGFEGDYRNGWTYSDKMNVKSREHLLEVIDRGFTTEKVLETYNEINDRLYADPDNVDRLGSMGQDTRRKRRADIAGCEFNVDKAMSGIWATESVRRLNASRTVRVFIDIGRNCDVKPEAILETACYGIAVAKVLETKGYAVEIDFGETLYAPKEYNSRMDRALPEEFIGDKGSVMALRYGAKGGDEKVDEAKLLTFSSVSTFRDVMFCVFAFGYGMGKYSGLGQSLYTTIPPYSNEEFYKEYLDVDVYIGGQDTLDTVITNVQAVIND